MIAWVRVDVGASALSSKSGDMSPIGRVFLGLACVIAAAQVLGAAEPSQPSRRVLTLRPAQVSGLRIDLTQDFRRIQPPFQKEPALEGRQIARGWIPTAPPTPLLRDITDGQLHVKADHDPDFTGGSLATYASQCRDGVHASFQGVQVFSRQGSLAIPYTLDLSTYRRGLSGWLNVRSGWTTRLETDSGCWMLTVIDNLDGQIDGQDRLILEPILPTDGSLSRHDCPAPQVLFLDGQAFHLDFQYQEAEKGIVLEATLTDLQLPMGELQVDASGCRSLALRDDRQVVLLSNLAGVLSVPVGRYRVEDCVLHREPNQWLGPVFSECGQEVSVESGRAASLRLGLALTNSIVVTRDRNLLAFKYRLVGAGGELYDYDNPANSPAFRVYKGPVRIGKGSFGFG
jgi:hypothetical protein